VEFLHRFAFAFAQQTVVDEDAGELLADGLVYQRGGYRGIDTAGQPEDDARLADRFADLFHRMLDVILRGPVLRRAADVEQVIANDLGAALGVENLRVKLDAVEITLAVLDDGEGRIVGRAD